MNEYSKVLTFFMENGIKLDKGQLKALKGEFLDETSITKSTDDKGNTVIKNAPKGVEYTINKETNNDGKHEVIEKHPDGKYKFSSMNIKDAEYIKNKAKEE